jgi:hypothetical protein
MTDWRLLEADEMPEAGDQARRHAGEAWQIVNIPTMWTAGRTRIEGVEFRTTRKRIMSQTPDTTTSSLERALDELKTAATALMAARDALIQTTSEIETSPVPLANCTREEYDTRAHQAMDAACDLCTFIATTEYPEPHSADFFKLTELADRATTALKRAGYHASEGRREQIQEESLEAMVAEELTGRSIGLMTPRRLAICQHLVKTGHMRVIGDTFLSTANSEIANS